MVVVKCEQEHTMSINVILEPTLISGLGFFKRWDFIVTNVRSYLPYMLFFMADDHDGRVR